MGELTMLAGQSGLISRPQALSVGMSPRTVSRRLQTKEWHPVLPGIYRHCAAVVDDELMARSALLWAGRDAALSGSWAAWWHGLVKAPLSAVSITVPRASTRRSRDFVQVRRRDLDVKDLVLVRGLQLVSRSLAALESVAGPHGEDALDHALQRHLRPAELEPTMRRMVGSTGAPAARRQLSAVSDGTVSPAERDLARALRKAGLGSVVAGVKVVVRGELLWLDFAVTSLKVAIEVDGVAAHTRPEVFHRDRERQNLLVADGWLILRYTPRQIRDDPARVVAEIRAALESRGG